MIHLKSRRELDIMNKAGSIVATVLSALKKHVKAGNKTRLLDEKAEDLIAKYGGRPAFKNYRGYPASICVSINEEIVHGIPGERKLCKGDVVSIDVGVEVDGYYADGAFTYAIDPIDRDSRHLIETTKDALDIGIKNSLVGNKLSDISCSIQEHVERNGLNVIKAFVGHGIGSKLHEPPEVPNFCTPDTNIVLEDGMVLAIEPMVCIGKEDVKILEDGWTAITADESRVAHFEHTVAITNNGPEVLTLCQKKSLYKLKEPS